MEEHFAGKNPFEVLKEELPIRKPGGKARRAGKASLDKEGKEPKTEDHAPSTSTPDSTTPAKTALQSITADPGVPQNPLTVEAKGGVQPKVNQVWP
jgi:hypothetical protein